MVKVRKRSKYILFMMSLLVLLLFITTPVSAKTEEKASTKSSSKDIDDSGSLRPENTEIYGEDKGVEITDEKQDSKPGMVEGFFIELFVTCGNFFDWLFKALGIDLKSIIFGRVDGAGIQFEGYRVALFTFEMSYGNIYGIVGSSVYSVLRSIIYIMLACVCFPLIVYTIFIGNSAKAIAKLKESFGNMFLAFLLLAFMPYLLDLFLYIRDIGIHLIGVDLLSEFGLNTPDITVFFKENAEDNIMFAAMYLGSFVLTVYLLFQYVGIALSFVVYMFAFPFVCINMQFDRRALGTWIKGIFNNAMIPIVDCCILLVPAFAGLLGDSLPIRFLQLLLCTLLIPARGNFRQAIGLMPGGGMELSGLLAMKGAMSIAGAAVGGTASAFGSKIEANQEAANDEKMANYYESLSKNGIRSGIRNFGNLGDIPNVGKGMSMSFSAGGINPQAASGLSGLGSLDSAGKSGGVGQQERDIMEPNFGNPYDAQDIADHYADISNFENRDFAGISNERRAQLYRERAADRRRKGTGAMIGGIAGTAVGMTAGLGASMFLSAGTKGMVMGALGSAMGKAGSDLGSKINIPKATNIGMTDSKIPLQSTNPTTQIPGLVPINTNEFGAVDYPDFDMVGKSYLKLNESNIQAASYGALDFANNEEVKGKLDSLYSIIRTEEHNLSEEEQYNKFRSASQQIVQKDFENRYKNSELKSCGNEQLDKQFNRIVQKKFKDYLASQDNFAMSRTNMELYGWKF